MSAGAMGWASLIYSRIGGALSVESTRQPEEKCCWKVVDDDERIDVSKEVLPQALKRTVPKGSPEKEDFDDSNTEDADHDKEGSHVAFTARNWYGNLTSRACGIRRSLPELLRESLP
jgi:hypothetical protein